MKIKYRDFNFREDTIAIISRASEIVSKFWAQGFDLTLRQLYYQFVAKALIPNTERSYKRLGSIINDARLAGMVDWTAIEDRTRALRGKAHWDSPREIIKSAAGQYAIERWRSQDCYIEVWIEKDALIGVIEGTCRKWDVNYFSCRGYVSQSEMWRASQRIIAKEEDGKSAHLIHLGDHDPSGIDMTRDIQDRLHTFGSKVSVHRIALNQKQITKYKPPPNPAKVTDSRAKEYIRKYGGSSWELDALTPAVISDMIDNEISGYVDADRYDEALTSEKMDREAIKTVAEKWESS